MSKLVARCLGFGISQKNNNLTLYLERATYTMMNRKLWYATARLSSSVPDAIISLTFASISL